MPEVPFGELSNNEAQYSNRGQVPVHNARAQQKQKITSQLTRTVRCGSASRLATARNALCFFPSISALATDQTWGVFLATSLATVPGT